MKQAYPDPCTLTPDPSSNCIISRIQFTFMNEEEGVPPRDDMPVQGIFDPETGRNITGEVAEQSRRDSEKELADVKGRAIANLANGMEIGQVMDAAREEIFNVLDRHYTGLKLPIDEDHLADLSGRLGAILVIYSQFMEELQQLSADTGLQFEISAEPRLAFHFGWETDQPGIFLTFPNNAGTLLAVPYCSMKTSSYGPFFFGGEPPAASILRGCKNGLLFVSQEGTPPSEVLDKLAQEEVVHPHIVPMLPFRQMGNYARVSLTDPECVDCPAEPGYAEFSNIIYEEKPEIMAIGVVTSGIPLFEIIPRDEMPLFP